MTPAAYTLKFINETRQSVFLTGQAGTGKTTLLREIIASTHKKTAVVAPTGIAALNAGGVTIHSFFSLPFATFLPIDKPVSLFPEHLKVETRETLRRHFRFSGAKKAVIRDLELLIIDEVSMLRADLLDAIDFALRFVRRNPNEFGGVQVLFIGDLMQLPPVVRPEQWDILKPYYEGKFFFQAHVLKQHPPLYVELSKIYRQSDDRFITLLNKLRNNQMAMEDVVVFDEFVRPRFNIADEPGCVILTTHNAKADVMNAEALAQLDGKPWIYEPEIIGDFPDKLYPLDAELRLKEGAQVMFVKNDPSPEKRFFNGKTGIVASLSANEIIVHFPGEDVSIEVDRYEWQNIRYYLDQQTREIKEEILGTFTHYPIKLAWAITVHKSQGLTFDKAALDVEDVFAPGQAYVALSRLRSLDGLRLLSPIRREGISTDPEVAGYAVHKTDENTLDGKLALARRDFLLEFLCDSFTWKSVAAAWHAHAEGYREEGPKSVRKPFTDWALRQSRTFADLEVLSGKFVQQLRRIFRTDGFDAGFVQERVDAAYDYFFPLIDKQNEELLLTKYQVAKIKKAKGFFDELTELEQLQFGLAFRIRKARRMMALFASGHPFDKVHFEAENHQDYYLAKIEKIRQILADRQEVIDEQAFETRSKAKKRKEPKKNTVEETHLLWQQNLSIKEIARERKLTAQTISTHMAKLIQAGSVHIRDVLPEDKVIALARAFIGFKGESLQPIKEKYGDAFTWDELKLFKASLQESQNTAMTAGTK